MEKTQLAILLMGKTGSIIKTIVKSLKLITQHLAPSSLIIRIVFIWLIASVIFWLKTGSNEIYIIPVLLFKLMNDVTLLAYTLLVATLLSALCWWLFSQFSKLRNKTYYITKTHHVLCLIATLLTFIFSFIFASLKYSEEVAQFAVLNWKIEIKSDANWQENTFREAYEAVKALNIEDFSHYPSPDDGGNVIPITKEEARLALINTFVNRANQHFNDTNPYIGKIIWAQTEIPTKIISEDVKKNISRSSSKNYSVDIVINLVAEYIKQALYEQTPHVVSSLRILLIILFMIIQAILFAMIAYPAYKTH